MITIPVSPRFHSSWFPDASAGTTITEDIRECCSNRSIDKFDPKSRLSETVPSDEVQLLSQSSSPPLSTGQDVLARAYNILDSCLSYYMPGPIDPDDSLVTEICKKTGDSTLDDILAPLTLLITRLCLSHAKCKSRLRNWLLPANLDRTYSLEARPNLLGRCLRLLVCVYHPKLKDAMGEMLFALCDSDGGIDSQVLHYNP